MENGTPQQYRKLWEATFDTPEYKAHFKEERGARNIVDWIQIQDDQKVWPCTFFSFCMFENGVDRAVCLEMRSFLHRESTGFCPNPTSPRDPQRKRRKSSTRSRKSSKIPKMITWKRKRSVAVIFIPVEHGMDSADKGPFQKKHRRARSSKNGGLKWWPCTGNEALTSKSTVFREVYCF